VLGVGSFFTPSWFAGRLFYVFAIALFNRHRKYLFIFLLKFFANAVSIMKIGFVKIKYHEKLLIKDNHAGAFDGSYLPHRMACLFLCFKN
jgi:hypothetical protein